MGPFPRQLARLVLYLSLAVLSACAHESARILQNEKEMVVGIAGGFACDKPELEAVGALVRQGQKAFCSGTLIAEDTVLTAAHCIEGEDVSELSFMIGAEPKTAVSYPIASGIPHPRYMVDKRGSYDMALLHLREPVLGVTPLPYRKASLPVYFRGQLTFVGFGDDNGAEKTGAGIKRCLRLYISRVNDFTFENSTPGHDTCHGDSGGPVLDYDYRDGRREIVGVITSGDGLCKEFGLSARVDVAAEWIARNASPPHVATGPLASTSEADAEGERVAELAPAGPAPEQAMGTPATEDFKRVEALLENERKDIQNPTNPGIIVATVSDQLGGMRSLAGGFYFDGVHTPGIGGKAVGFLPAAASVEAMAGTVRLEGRSSFLFSFSSLVGPRLRLGAPHGLVLGAYYYLPAVLVMHGRARFPLLGVGASLGYQSAQAHISLVYRYAMTHVLYSDEPNVHFLGLALAFPTENSLW